MEPLLIQGLAGAQTRAGKDFFCRQLVLVGTEAAVPELAKLLTDPESSHIARYALARIRARRRTRRCWRLGKADEKLKMGLVHSLGTRGCRAAVDQIDRWSAAATGSWRSPRCRHSGRIDSDAAVAAVARARRPCPQVEDRRDGRLAGLRGRLVKQGRTDRGERDLPEAVRRRKSRLRAASAP